jgi:hypothetical protein
LHCFIFGNVWLNVGQGINILHIQNEYAAGLGVVFILGIAKIIDAGTGVNSVIIATSTFWKFEFLYRRYLTFFTHSVSLYFYSALWHYRPSLC